MFACREGLRGASSPGYAAGGAGLVMVQHRPPDGMGSHWHWIGVPERQACRPSAAVCVWGIGLLLGNLARCGSSWMSEQCDRLTEFAFGASSCNGAIRAICCVRVARDGDRCFPPGKQTASVSFAAGGYGTETAAGLNTAHPPVFCVWAWLYRWGHLGCSGRSWMSEHYDRFDGICAWGVVG